MSGSSLVLVASLLSLVLGQEYAAPSGQEYDAYAPPSTGYGEPSTSYDYGYDQGGYVATQEDGLDLGKLTDLIPIFVVVFAAIILAQLIAPLFTTLFTLIVAIIPGTLSFKAPIINALLNPFELQLCTTDAVPVAFTGSRSFSARDMEGVFDSQFFSSDKLNMLATVVDEAVNAFSNMNV